MFHNPIIRRTMLMESNNRSLTECFNMISDAVEKWRIESRDDYLNSITGMHDDEKITAELLYNLNSGTVLYQNPKFIYTSLVVSWYSFIEVELYEICMVYFKNRPFSLKPSDLSDKGIRQYKNYLTKVVGLEIRQLDWDELFLIAELRNKIVHKGPYFDVNLHDFKPELIKYLEKRGLILDSPIRKIEISRTYCSHLLDFGVRLLRRIYSSDKHFSNLEETP